jgi:Fungal Zn(2)-Cys(6) binuclear cluster domain/Zinc finger, C2H2 type
MAVFRIEKNLVQGLIITSLSLTLGRGNSRIQSRPKLVSKQNHVDRFKCHFPVAGARFLIFARFAIFASCLSTAHRRLSSVVNCQLATVSRQLKLPAPSWAALTGLYARQAYMSKVIGSCIYSQQNACSRPDFMTMRIGANLLDHDNAKLNSTLKGGAQPPPPPPQPQPQQQQQPQPQPQPIHQDREKATTSNEGPSQDQGFYQCSTCKKTYNRADHLIRHVRSHTHEKPYVCETCGKGFARPDLLKRHASGHEDEEKSPTEGNSSKKRKLAPNYNPSQSSRVTQACRQCASSKLKCSEGKPCERCKKKNLACDEASPDANTKPADDDAQVINGFHTQAGDYRNATNAEQYVPQGSHGELSDRSSNQTPNSTSELIVANGVLEFNGTYFPEFLRNVVAEPGSSRPTARSDPSGLNQGFFPQNYVGLCNEDADFGWASDLWYSDSLQDAFNMPFESTFIPYAPTMSSSSENASLAGVGADAFKGSLIGSWTPQPEDSSMMERQNLVAPKNVDSLPLFTESKKILIEPLSLHARDRILGMVLETCPHSASSRIIASFPSVEFLNNCIQYYFCRRHEEQIDSYIHLPTLKPNDQKAELLAMLAAAGAVCTASGVVRKLGYALQESVRHAVQRRVGIDSIPFLTLS